MRREIHLRLALWVPRSRALTVLAILLCAAVEPGSETLTLNTQFPIDSAMYDSIVTTGDSIIAGEARDTRLNTLSGNVYLVPSDTNLNGRVGIGQAAPAEELHVGAADGADSHRGVNVSGLIRINLGGPEFSFGTGGNWHGSGAELHARPPSGNFYVQASGAGAIPGSNATYLQAGPTAGPGATAGVQMTSLVVGGTRLLGTCQRIPYLQYSGAWGGAPCPSGCPAGANTCTCCPTGFSTFWAGNALNQSFWENASATLPLSGTMLCCPIRD